MSLIITGGERPRIRAGSGLQRPASEYPTASDKTIKAFTDNLEAATSLEQVSNILQFINDNGMGIAGSRDNAFSASILSRHIDTVAEIKNASGENIVFMWNLFTRTLGLRKRVMQLAGCSDELIASYH